MNTADLFAPLPFLLIAGSAVFVMLTIAAWRRHWLSLGVTLIGLAAAFGSLSLAAPLAPRRITPLLILDQYALFYIGLILATTFAIAILCYGYLQRHSETREELYILLLVATVGSMVLVASSHFVSFFLGLELLSVALYALSAFLHTRSRPLEAGIKYLILAGSSSAFLLFGMALIYAQTGTMELFRLATSLAGVQNSPLVSAGLIFMVTGIGFKLGVVPFHLWTPGCL
jgi:NADH-quinone oxidoreductase subunit N